MARIKNFYEDRDFILRNFERLVYDSCRGFLLNATEKLDGQNFTFKYSSKYPLEQRVRFLGKVNNSKLFLTQEGVGRDVLIEKYSDNQSVQKAFLGAYDALSELFDSIVNRDGLEDFAVSAEILCLETRNIIWYPRNEIRFLNWIPLTDDAKSEKYTSLCDIAKSVTEKKEWKISQVPTVKFKPRLDREDKIFEFSNKFDKLRKEFHCTGYDQKMEDLRCAMVASSLKDKLPSSIIERAAWRLANEEKSALTKKHAGSSWKDFQTIESECSIIVNEALMPLEELFREFSSYVISTATFSLSESENIAAVDNALTKFYEIRNAVNEGRVKTDSLNLKRIKSAIKRCPNPNMFASNVEGIVFEWPTGKKRKLVGYYTPINRVLGYFRYGKNPAKII